MIKQSRVLGWLCSALACSPAITTASPRFTIVQILPPAGSGAYGIGAHGINNRGDVVGGYSQAAPNRIGAFIYTDAGGTVDLAVPGKWSTDATGINDAGQISLSTSEPVTGHWRFMYRYTQGIGIQELPTLGGYESETRGINSHGHITGSSDTPDGDTRAFRYTDASGIQNLSGTLEGTGFAINDRGWIAGARDEHAMLYRDEGNIDLGPGRAYGINNAGHVVGETLIVPGHPTAFVYRNGEMTILGDDVYSQPVLFDINNKGQAVGRGYFVDEDLRLREAALFWSEQTGLVDLNTFIPKDSNWELWVAGRLNDVGQIIGFGSGGAFRLDPILDPAEALARCITLVEDSNLSRKSKQPLLAILNAAAASLERGDYPSAIGQLTAFQNKVRAQITRDDPALANALIKCAQDVLTAIEHATAPAPPRPSTTLPPARFQHLLQQRGSLLHERPG